MKPKMFPRMSSFAARWVTATVVAVLAVAAPADRIVKTNGAVIQGTIVGETATHVIIRTPFQVELSVRRTEIVEIERELKRSPEERDADSAMGEERFEAAVALYESAIQRAATDEDRERLQEKLNQAKNRIEQRDMARIEQLFRSFDDFLQARRYDQSEAILQTIQRDFRHYPAALETLQRKRALIHLRKARDAEDSVNPVLMDRELQRALSLDPELLDAHLMAVRIYSARSDSRERAVGHLEKAIELGAGRLDTMTLVGLQFQLAEIYFQRQDFERALELFTKVKDAAPTRFPQAIDREIDCLSAIGDRLLDQAGGIERAIERYTEAIHRNPNHPRIRTIRRQLGQLYLAKNPPEPDLALEQFLAIQSEQVIPDLFHLIARAYIAQGEIDKAIDSLEKEIAVNRANYNAHIDLARLYLDQRQFTRANQVLITARDSKPDSYEAFLLIGRLRRLQERYEEAKAALNVVLAKDPEHREARLLFGLVLFEEGQPQQSAEFFERVIAAFRQQIEREGDLNEYDSRTMAEAINARARVDIHNRQFRLALSRLNQSLQMDEQLADTHFFIGEARRQLGDFSGARDAYLRAIERTPFVADYHLSLGILYHNNLNQPQQAAEHYYRYFDLGGTDFIRVNKWLEELGMPTRDIPVGT